MTMTIEFLPAFISDLQQQADANFGRRVFAKLFDGNGRFRIDVNDHRYNGIENAWIRYVSQGSTAYRVIYLREGDRVLLYRAGPHSIEDNLSQPPSVIPAAYALESDLPFTSEPNEEESLGRFISSLRTPHLSQMVLSRRLIPHKEVVLVSPFISQSLLIRTAKLGRLLDNLVEDGTKVSLITLPPKADDLSFFSDLEARGIELLFHPRLHAKLYVFCVDHARVSHGRNYDDLIIVGSANLTERGFGATRDVGNEELCYEIPITERHAVERYLAFLALHSADLIKLRIDASRQKKRV